MEQLGERIKRVRKERKMTLADVAGDKLTKGMLSLIENGKANPSMESLQYIASQLGIPSSDLMQSESQESLREKLLKAERLLTEYKEVFSEERRKEIEQAYQDHLYTFFENRPVTGNSYEEIRLYEIYLFGRHYIKKEYNVEDVKKVAEMYENIHAFSRILNAYNFMAIYEFSKLNYHGALDYMLQGEKKLNQYEHFIDPIEKLDFYYNLTVMYAAVNDEVQMEKYLDLAMELSKEKKIFYRLNDFYRFLYYVSLQRNDIEKVDYYVRKMKDYVQLIEDPLEEVLLQIILLVYHNLVEKDYEYVVNFEFDEERFKELKLEGNAFIMVTKGYALYSLGRHMDVLEITKELTIPLHHTHPIDLAFLYQGFGVRAASHLALGNVEEAKRDILYAYDGVKSFSQSTQKQFIIDVYEKIMGVKP